VSDARAGLLSQTETGSDRYSLLEQFNNVANTGSGNQAGNMDYSPYGQAYADPPPGASIFATYSSLPQVGNGFQGQNPATPIIAGDKVQGFPEKVFDVFPLAFWTLASGSPNETLRRLFTPAFLAGGIGGTSIYDLVQQYSKSKQEYKGWAIAPYELRITALKFAPAKQGGIGRLPPREGQVSGFVMTQKDGLLPPMPSTEKFPLAHFLIDGYWIFKLTKGNEEKYIAVKLNFVAGSQAHSGYDEAFAKFYEEFKQKTTKANKDAVFGPVVPPGGFIIPRDYFEGELGVQLVKSIQALSGLLKTAPNGNLNDLPQKDVQMVTLDQLLKDFFPNSRVLDK
jgi:hypothetical protein